MSKKVFTVDTEMEGDSNRMPADHFFFNLIVFLSGLCFGSFLNVVVYRLPRRLSLWKPPSSCPSCGRRLGPLELVPLLGYLLLQGRCAHCRSTISPRYPLAELATALLFSYVYLAFGLTLTAGGYMFLLFLLLAISLIDLEHRLIPNSLVSAGLAGGVILQLPAMAANWLTVPARLMPERLWLDAVFGLLLGGGVMLIIFLVSRGGMGAGDMKLMALIGFFVGLRGTAVVMMLGFTAGALTGLLLIALGRLTRKDALPFGPFLSLAVLVELFWGELIWNWYIHLLR
ncbi:MAG: A24 family peptidase [Bacillota bacterium]